VLNEWFGLPFGGPERIVLTGFATAAEQGLKGSRRSPTYGPRPGDEIFKALCGLMEDGARTVLFTRWRTGGKTNFDLVREFARELPNAPATEAWQRACLLAREEPMELSLEPRLKRSADAAELPGAGHPFFWAGYLLADTTPRPDDVAEDAKAEDAEPAARAAVQNKLPMPAKPGEGAIEPSAQENSTAPPVATTDREE
jgi:hypothetical protein